MVDAVHRAGLQCKPVQPRDILPVRSRPALAAVADIGGGALLPRELDQIRDQPGPAGGAVNLRQPDRHRAHAARRVRQTGLFRHARNCWVGLAPHLFGDQHARRDETRARGDDERLVGADKHLAHGLDGRLVDGAVLRELREIMDEGQMDHAVGILRAALQAVEVRERAAMDFGAERLQRADVVVRAGEACDLMPVGDELFGGFAADESGGAGDEYAHERESLFRAQGILVAFLSGKSREIIRV